MFLNKGKKSISIRLFSLILAIGLIFSLTGCGGSPAASSNGTSGSAGSGSSGSASSTTSGNTAKPIELRLAHMWASTHAVETTLTQGWIKAVEQATNGRVKITSYPAETLAKGPETYDAVVKDVADIGLGVYGYTRGRFPMIETFLLPGIGFKNAKSGDLAITEAIKTLKPKELDDTHQLFSWTAGLGYLMSKTPIRQLSDIKGMELGVSAGPRADAVKMLGATPITLPMPEWYEALQKGTMKAGDAPLETLQGFRLGEVTGNYLTETPFLYNQIFFAVMNKDKWNSIPPDVQKQITDATDKFYNSTVVGLFDKINDTGLKWAQDKKKIEMIKLSADETKKWTDLIQPVQDQYVKDITSKGLDGKKFLDTAKQLADKYNKQ